MTTAAVEFDPFSDEYFNDPTEVYRRLRDEVPVYFSERYGFYTLSRFADVVSAHRDWQGFSSAHGIDLSTLSMDAELIETFHSIIMMDPPEHDRLHTLVSRVFTPRGDRARTHDPRSDHRVRRPVRRRGHVRCSRRLLRVVPDRMISRLLGVPAADRQDIRQWLDLSLHREEGQLDPTPEGIDEIARTGAYFYELAVEKRKNPGDDMIDAPHAGRRRPRRRRGDRARRRRDRRVRDAARRGGCRDRDQARRQHGRAVRAPSRPVAEGPRRLCRGPRRGRGDPPLPPAVAVPGSVLHRGAHIRGRNHSRGLPRASSPARPPAIPASSRTPTRSTSNGRRTSPSGWATACTACLGAALTRMESRVAIEALAQRWQHLEIDEAGLKHVPHVEHHGVLQHPPESTPSPNELS